MDRQLRVTDNICEQYMRDFELNFLCNLGSHMDSHGNTPRNDTLKQAAESRAQSWPSGNERRSRAEQVADLRLICVLFLDLSVPVV